MHGANGVAFLEREERELLRWTFDSVAELYDRIRPSYPQELLLDLARLCGVGPGSRALEIGCGTGKFTAQLAAYGLSITAVELGAGMAGVARRRLAGFPDVEIVVSDFERLDVPLGAYDLVVSATAFHWLDPGVRVARCADALRPGGSLAVVDTHHIDGGDRQFFLDAQECYLRHDPGAKPGYRLPTPAQIPLELPDLEQSERFGGVTLARYEWEETYSATDYRDLLLTYSDVQRLGERGMLLARCLEAMIERSYGGTVAKRYLSELRIARTPSGAL